MRKVRERSLSLSDAQNAIGDFRNHFDNQYILLSITDKLVRQAMSLPEKHKLRAYDALQLAAALTISSLSVQQGIAATGIPPLVVVASDQDLLSAAQTEGLVTEDPTSHP